MLHCVRVVILDKWDLGGSDAVDEDVSRAPREENV